MIPPSATPMLGVPPGGQPARGVDDRDEGEAGPEVARHATADDHEEDERPDAREEDRRVRVEAHQDRRQDRRAEHREDVLESHRDRLPPRQPFVRSDDPLALQGPVKGAAWSASIHPRPPGQVKPGPGHRAIQGQFGGWDAPDSRIACRGDDFLAVLHATTRAVCFRAWSCSRSRTPTASSPPW